MTREKAREILLQATSLINTSKANHVAMETAIEVLFNQNSEDEKKIEDKKQAEGASENR